MSDASKSIERARGAVTDSAQLLELAHRAVDRARIELRGEALGVAERLSQQLHFLRKVADVLGHEIERVDREESSLPRSLK
jgi:Trm5-related predicted tRNA methylase